jgi:hypothetical protein
MRRRRGSGSSDDLARAITGPEAQMMAIARAILERHGYGWDDFWFSPVPDSTPTPRPCCLLMPMPEVSGSHAELTQHFYALLHDAFQTVHRNYPLYLQVVRLRTPEGHHKLGVAIYLPQKRPLQRLAVALKVK